MLNYFDFLSMKPEIYIKGEERYYTKFGAIMSIISTIVQVAISCYFLQILISRKNFQIYENNIKLDFPVLNYSNYPIGLSLAYVNGSMIPENYYEITAIFAEYKATSSGEIKYVYTFSDRIELCSENNNKFFNYTKGLHCLPPKMNFTLYGTFGNVYTGFSMMFFPIFKCKNGTFYDEYGGFHNNSNCADKGRIDKALNDARLIIEFLDTSMNHNDIEPFKYKKMGTVLFVSTVLFNDHFMAFQNVEYNSDFGFVFEETYSENTFKFNSIETRINIKTYESGLFSTFKVLVTDQKLIYSRIYQKLQVTLANIGGFAKFIMMISQLIVNIISEKFYMLYLINKFFAVESCSNNTIKYNSKTIQINLKTTPNAEVLNKSSAQKISTSNFINVANLQSSIKLNKNLTIDRSNINQTSSNPLPFSTKLKYKLTKILKLQQFKSKIWNYIFTCKKKISIQQIKIAKTTIRKILSMNTILKMHLKIENIIDVIFTDSEIEDFDKLNKIII